VSGGEGNGTFRYQLDSTTGTWTEINATTFTHSVEFGHGETHTIYVQERDDAGNWSTSGSFAVAIDTTGPGEPAVTGQEITNSELPTWSWISGGDGNGTYRYQLDSETGIWFETTATSYTPETPHGDGESHTLYVQERDDAGNWSLSGAYSTTIDSSGPYISSTIPSEGATDIEPRTAVVIHLRDSGSGINAGTIAVFHDGNAVDAGLLGIEDADPEAVTVTYSPPLPFDAGQTVLIEVDVADQLGSGIDTAANSFSFTIRDNTIISVLPGESIQVAMDSGTGGDTVNISAGTYQENLVLDSSHTGIHLLGSDAYTCFLEGVSVGMPTIQLQPGADGVAIDGFSISGSGAGIVVEGSGTTIQNNIIHDIENGDGVLVYSDNANRVQNNVVYGASGAGICIMEPAAAIVRGKLDASGLVLMHNTIAENSTGIRIDGFSPIVQYNIIASNFEFGILVESGSPTLGYNNVWDNGSDETDDGVGDENYMGTAPGDNDISVDSLFVSRDNNDYDVTVDSPCIDGVPAEVAESQPASPSFDLVGRSRPLPADQDYDIGAYEFDPDAEELTITSTPIAAAAEDSVYTYQVTAEGAGIRYRFDETSDHPPEMTIDETTGIIEYLAETDAAEGSYTVIVVATDRFNRSETQTYTLAVAPTNDPPRFVTEVPASGTRYALAMLGQTYTFELRAYDEEFLGTEELLTFSLAGTYPSGMRLAASADGTTVFVDWGPGVHNLDDTDVGDTVSVRVDVTDGVGSGSLIWDISVIDPLTIAPNGKILLRTLENGAPIDFVTDFTVSGGYADDGQYVYEILDAGFSPPVVDDCDTVDIVGGSATISLSTEILSSLEPEDTVFRQIRIIDSVGFEVTSGLIEVRNVAVTKVADETFEDPRAGGQVDINSADTEYTGATITVPPAGPGADGFTLEFNVVEESSEPVPDDQKGNFGQVIEIKIEPVGDGQPPTFDSPIEVTLPFSALNVDPARVDDVRVYTFDEETKQWTALSDYSIDSENETITFRVSHFSLFTVGLPDIFEKAIAGGADPEYFHMISFPGKPDETDLLTVLEKTLGGYDDREWRSAAYDGDSAADPYDEISDADFAQKHPLQPGRSYWLISRENAQITANGLTLDRTVPFDLVLKPGWNMIANPFDEDIRHGSDVYLQVSSDGYRFIDIASANNRMTESVYYRFDPRPNAAGSGTEWYTAVSFSDSGEYMKPKTGYWIRNEFPADVVLRFSPEPLLLASLKDRKASMKSRIARGFMGFVDAMVNTVTKSAFADLRQNSTPPPHRHHGVAHRAASVLKRPRAPAAAGALLTRCRPGFHTFSSALLV